MIKYIIFLIICCSIYSLSAKTLSGIIKDYNEVSLSGASIRIEGLPIGAISKSDGRFTINNLPDNKLKISIIVSLVGYKTFHQVYQLDSQVTNVVIYLEIQPLQLDEVVVTANKRVQQVQEVPISVSVIDSRGIMDRGITKLDEALKYIPGVEVNQDNVNIRGTSGFSFGIGSRVSLLLDGFPMLAGDNNDMKFDALPMMNISRIEVVKGAGSALYGTSALGGVINLITEEPSDNLEIKLNTFTGIYTKPRYEQWVWTNDNNLYSGIHTSISKRFNNFNLLASAQYFSNNGYREYNDETRGSVFTKMKYKLNDYSHLSLLFNYTSADRADWVYWNSLDSATLPPTNTNKNIRLHSDQISIFGDYNYIINDNNFLSVRTGAFITKFNNSYNESNLEYRQSNAVNFNTEVQMNTNVSEFNNLTYGMNVNLINVNSITYNDRTQNIYSGYFQWELSQIKDLVGTFGARFDYEDTKYVESNLEISPKIGLSYKLIDKLNLRASAGRGFRAPSVAERFSSVEYQGFDVLPNPDLKPEISWSYEFGINYETKIANNSIFLDFSIFRNDLDNLIEPTFANSSTANIQFRNVQQARIQGIELTAKSFLLNVIGLESSFTLMDPMDMNLNQTLNYRSKLLWYNRIIIPLGLVELQMDYRYKQKYDNIDKQLGLIIKDIDARVDIHILDARLLFNLSNFINKDIRIILSARNLLDYYYTEMVGNLGATRMIMLQLDAKL